MGGEPMDDRDVISAMKRHIGVLNRLEPHLGCVLCRGPLTDGVCPECQPESKAN